MENRHRPGLLNSLFEVGMVEGVLFDEQKNTQNIH